MLRFGRTRADRDGGRKTRRLVASLLAAGAVLAATATVASAGPSIPPTQIPGNPLTVYIGPRSQMQAFTAGSTQGIYYQSSDTIGDAGFFLAFPHNGGGPPELVNVGGNGTVWGFTGSAGPGNGQGEDPLDYTPDGQDPVTGSGTASDPFTLVTHYSVPTGTTGVDVKVKQTTTYVNGTSQFENQWDVTNNTGVDLNFRALAAADFFFEGDDRGTGIFTLGPPRFIGGTNVDTGTSGGFVEDLNGSPAWTHYQELPYDGLGTGDDVWTKVDNAALGTSPTAFDDTVDPDDVDNAGGVEWDGFASGTKLVPSHTATFKLISRVAVPSALQLSPTNAGAPQGVPINITATALDSSGNPYAGRTLHYDTTGVNPGSGNVTLNAAGQGVITDPGTNAGGDTIAAFVDFNGDNTREAAEPQASALATFVDHTAPNCKVTVKGDRPGGGGGAGNALVITVNCNETAQISVATTLQAPAAHHSSVAAAKKHKKKRIIKLPRTTATIQPGAAVPVKIKVPKSIARKYAGKTLKAKLVVTVKDGVGNTKKVTTTKKIKIAKPKHKKHKH